MLALLWHNNSTLRCAALQHHYPSNVRELLRFACDLELEDALFLLSVSNGSICLYFYLHLVQTVIVCTYLLPATRANPSPRHPRSSCHLSVYYNIFYRDRPYCADSFRRVVSLLLMYAPARSYFSLSSPSHHMARSAF